MHAGFLDVLHNAADDDVSAVGKRVHVNFRGFFEKLIYEHRLGRAHQRGPRYVFLNRVRVIRDDHGAATEDITWPDQNRQTDFSGEAPRFFWNHRGAVARLRNLLFIENAAEAAAIFREVNGLWRQANDWA